MYNTIIFTFYLLLQRNYKINKQFQQLILFHTSTQKYNSLYCIKTKPGKAINTMTATEICETKELCCKAKELCWSSYTEYCET